MIEFLSPFFHFPTPTGPYAIGTRTYHWVDSSRPELFLPESGLPRELMAQIWYPARPMPQARRAPYIADADAVLPALARLMHAPPFFFRRFKDVTTHAAEDAPFAENLPACPVLIYLTGLNGFRSASTFQIEELVSHGYIVVGLDQPGASALVKFPDGHQIVGWSKAEIEALVMQSVEPQLLAPHIQGKPLPEGITPYFAQDVSFTLDQLAALDRSDPFLAGRLDLERTGVFGISLGGMTAAEACHIDPRLKAGVIMDVWIPADVVKAGLPQPTLLITRDAATMRLEHRKMGGWTEKDIDLTLSTMRALYERLAGAGYYLQAPNLFHLNFVDVPYWSPLLRPLGLVGPIDRRRGSAILNATMRAFFDCHLKGMPSPLLAGPSKEYPEVIFEKRGE